MNPVTKSLVYSLWILMASLYTTAARAAIHEDMVRFDQVYIPALALSNQGSPQTAKAMDTLINYWTTFKQNHAYTRPTDAQWDQDLNQIEEHIIDADRLVEQGQLNEAHEALEAIRFIFLHLRERYRMDYFVDGLTRFHEPMEAIALRAVGREAATLTAEDRAAMAEDLKQAMAVWQGVMNQTFNPYQYDMGDEQAGKLRQLIEKEWTLLQSLATALQGDAADAILQAGRAVKPTFVQAFLLFGRFPAGAGAGAG